MVPLDYIKTNKKNVTIILAAFDEMVTSVKETIRISIIVGYLLMLFVC